jgi:hypothetical protein
MTCAAEVGSGDMIYILYIPSSMTIVSGYCLYNLRGCNIDVTEGRDFTEMLSYG